MRLQSVAKALANNQTWWNTVDLPSGVQFVTTRPYRMLNKQVSPGFIVHHSSISEWHMVALIQSPTYKGPCQVYYQLVGVALDAGAINLFLLVQTNKSCSRFISQRTVRLYAPVSQLTWSFMNSGFSERRQSRTLSRWIQCQWSTKPIAHIKAAVAKRPT